MRHLFCWKRSLAGYHEQSPPRGHKCSPATGFLNQSHTYAHFAKRTAREGAALLTRGCLTRLARLATATYDAEAGQSCAEKGEGGGFRYHRPLTKTSLEDRRTLTALAIRQLDILGGGPRARAGR